MAKAIQIIHDEHRSFAAVLNGLLSIIEGIREGKMQPDFFLLKAMLHYIEEFPEKVHHPKEDQYLYRLLRQRDAGIVPLLDELEREHVRGRALVLQLEQAIKRYEAQGAAGFSEFSAVVSSYAEFHWAHMLKEEKQVLPVAEKALSAEDWAEIDQAFLSNADPLVGADSRREFRELFRQIVNLAPAPIGVGGSGS